MCDGLSTGLDTTSEGCVLDLLDLTLAMSSFIFCTVLDCPFAGMVGSFLGGWLSALATRSAILRWPAGSGAEACSSFIQGGLVSSMVLTRLMASSPEMLGSKITRQVVVRSPGLGLRMTSR